MHILSQTCSDIEHLGFSQLNLADNKFRCQGTKHTRNEFSVSKSEPIDTKKREDRLKWLMVLRIEIQEAKRTV